MTLCGDFERYMEGLGMSFTPVSKMCLAVCTKVPNIIRSHFRVIIYCDSNELCLESQ